jgi:hypothetical protein
MQKMVRVGATFEIPIAWRPNPPIAVPKLLYPISATLKWLFSQEKATFHETKYGT